MLKGLTFAVQIHWGLVRPGYRWLGVVGMLAIYGGPFALLIGPCALTVRLHRVELAARAVAESGDPR